MFVIRNDGQKIGHKFHIFFNKNRGLNQNVTGCYCLWVL